MPRGLQLVLGLALVAAGAFLVLSPLIVADALDKPHGKPTEMINLRATYGGTLAGIGAFIAWLPAWRPRWRAFVGLLMWSMAAIGIARLVGFVLDGSPDTRQYIWIVAEVAIVVACAVVLRRKR